MISSIFQKIIASVFFLLLLPLFITISILILFFVGKPVFYKQKRIGKNNVMFKMYKYRTMLNGVGDIPTSNVVNPDSMITVTGKIIRKYSIDEIPQLINVIFGDMNLIGYRPCLPNEYDLIESRKNYELNKYKPGMTGWAQINGRDKLNAEEKSTLDYHYYSNHSLFLDIKILILTVYVVIYRKDISH